jgi:Subtilase family
VSPNTIFPLDMRPTNPITERVLKDPNITYDVADGALVFAMKAELLVRRSAREAYPQLNQALSAIARNGGSLAAAERKNGASSSAVSVPDPDGPFGDVEIWRLNNPSDDSIDEARRLRVLAHDEPVRLRKGPTVLVPAVSPNHLSILSSKADGCPASPPNPMPSPLNDEWVPSAGTGPTADVVVLDSGYISVAPSHPAHANLDARVSVRHGYLLDAGTAPASWDPDTPDGLTTDAEGRLDGIVGHGTFVAGLIAHICAEARLTVVGQRDQEFDITPLTPSEHSRLFAAEASIAHSMLLYADTNVIQCGFSFPTLDDYPPIALVAAMRVLAGDDAPRPGVAVVAPAGNEESSRRYWPSALPDVIGVAATNRRGNARAYFSNWGKWCDCCTRGEDVFSTFVWWDGPIDGEPLTDIEHFVGWARWDGTSFAAPKVSAAIACLIADSGGEMTGLEAWDVLVSGRSRAPVSWLTDYALTPSGVTLPQIRLG